MPTATRSIEELTNREYKYGFVTDIEEERVRPGLDEDVIRLISTKKGEPDWLLEWRLKAYRHWLTMTEPTWQNVHYPPIDYQAIVYYSAPKRKKGPASLEEFCVVRDPARRVHRSLRRFLDQVTLAQIACDTDDTEPGGLEPALVGAEV